MIWKGMVVVLAGVLMILSGRATAQDASLTEPALAIAVGDPGSPSYKVGLWLTFLFQAESNLDRAEMWESLSPAERVLVLSEEAELAVIPARDAELQKPRARKISRVTVSLADGHQVLVRADLSNELVYDLTRLMFEYSDLMKVYYSEAGDLEPRASLARLEGAVHPGALRFYEQSARRQSVAISLAADLDAPDADLPTADPTVGSLTAADNANTAPPGSKSFTVYFDFDDAEFDMRQIDIVQEACGYAANLPAAEFILSGHADTAGPELYNDRLSLARAQSVASVIRNDPRFRDALNVIKFGESKLAVPTADEVVERGNRRVVITVVPSQVDNGARAGSEGSTVDRRGMLTP